MSKKLTTEEVAERVIKAHGNDILLDKFIYVNSQTKAIFKCNKNKNHGYWETLPVSVFKDKTGCPKCAGRNYSQHNIIRRIKKIHGNNIELDKFVYKGTGKKSIFKCNKNSKHGYWTTTVNCILSGQGCPRCVGKYQSKQDIIKKIKKIHKNRIGFDKFKFTKTKDKGMFTCNVNKKHGHWRAPVRNLISNETGCPKCYLESKYLNQKMAEKGIINKHGNDINLDKFIYKGSNKKYLFGCNINKKHGYWKAKHCTVVSNTGCPKCKISKGESEIEKFLIKNKIKFDYEKRFSDCKNKIPLPFDFYLKKYNLIIEFDGPHHYRAVNFNGMSSKKANKVFDQIQINDIIKTFYCQYNKINLLRIPYWDIDNIPNLIKVTINKLNPINHKS